jgi:hypothetical protein
MGLFAEWQPRYAEHRVATFPVTPDKKPAVRHYQKIGTSISRQYAMRFPDHDAFGVGCKISRLTILDVDTNDERILADGLDEFGPTPFIVRSGSGNFQAWYRNNGEGRRVRPDPRRPIDILGNGFVVAPPSVGRKGQYQIIAGSLDDLDHLPKMKTQPTPLSDGIAASAMPANDDDDVDVPPSPIRGRSEYFNSSEHYGERNDTLWKHCMKHIRGCRNFEELVKMAMEYNREHFYQPLPDAEVLAIVASALSYESQGKNWFGRGARVVLEHEEVDDLASSEPYAFALLTILRRHHWGRDFALAKVFADSLGWTLMRFKEARAVLVKRGLIECVHPGGKGRNDPPIYRFTKGCEINPQ